MRQEQAAVKLDDNHYSSTSHFPVAPSWAIHVSNRRPRHRKKFAAYSTSEYAAL